MALEIKCEGCAARYRVKDELAGQYVQCRKCQTPILVAASTPNGKPVQSVNAAPAPPSVTVARSSQEPAAARPPVAPARPGGSAVSASANVSPPTSRTPPPPAASDDADEDIVRFRDDDDHEPTKASYSAEDDDADIDLVPDPRKTPPRRSNPATRSGSPAGGSIAGGSLAGGSLSGGSLSGGSLSGGSLSGGSLSGGSRAGSSRSGGSIPGRSVTAVAMDARASRSGQPVEHDAPTLDASIDQDSASFDDTFELAEPDAPPVEDELAFHFTIPVLPVFVTHTLIPWGLTLGCLGWAGYTAGMRLMELPGHAVGFSLLAGAVLLYAALIVPTALKGIHSAAITGELRLPNAVWFQTFGLFALPTGGMVLGYLSGGTSTMILLGVLGLVAACVLMAFVYRATVPQTLLTAFYGASYYVLGTAIGCGIIAAAGAVLARSGFVVPWQTAPVEVAKVDQPVATPAAPVVKAVEAPKPVEVKSAAPVVVEKVAPAPVVPAGPAWTVPVEPLAADAMWPATYRAVAESLDVGTPVETAHPSDGSPLLVVLEPKTTSIFDLRSGKKIGFVKAAFQRTNFVLSPDGSLIAAVESLASQNSALFTPDAQSNSIEVWSTKDGKMLGRIPADPAAVVPVPLGFANGKLLGFGSSGGLSGLQAWDPATGVVVRQWSTPLLKRSTIAISHSGKFVAIPANPVIRVLNVETGEVAGELSSPVALREMKGIAFSPDGSTLAALVAGDVVPGDSTAATGSTADTLLEWSVANGGKLQRALTISLAAAAEPFNPDATPTPVAMNGDARKSDLPYFQWNADGRTVRVGDGLFEATSGKPVYTMPSQMAGNLVGRLAAISPKQSVFEFPPVGNGSRLLFKSVPLPTASLDVAIASAAASVMTTQPAQAGEAMPAVAASATPSDGAPAAGVTASGGVATGVMTPGATATPSTLTPQPMSPPIVASAVPAGVTTPASGASGVTIVSAAQNTVPPGTTPASSAGEVPHATVQLALQRQWDVTIKTITRADPVAIQTQLIAANALTNKLQDDLQASEMDLAKVSHYREGVDGTGEIVRQYEFPDEVRGTARQKVSHVQDEIRDNKANVIKLQKAAAAAPTSRTATATLDNGIPVTITTESDVSAAQIDAMHPGDHVHIFGFGQISDGTLIVKLRGAAQATGQTTGQSPGE